MNVCYKKLPRDHCSLGHSGICAMSPLVPKHGKVGTEYRILGTFSTC